MSARTKQRVEKKRLCDENKAKKAGAIIQTDTQALTALVQVRESTSDSNLSAGKRFSEFGQRITEAPNNALARLAAAIVF